MKSVIYIVDLDGTLVDNSHRQHLIPEDKSNTAEWVAFNCACENDEPREPVRQMVESLLECGKQVVFVTGRGEAARTPTISSLRKMFPATFNFFLVMRPMEDHRCPSWFKRDVIAELSRVNPSAEFMAFEDDPDVVESMRFVGISVMHIESKCAAVNGNEANK